MTLPTRVIKTATFIDKILTSNYENKWTSLNIPTSIADHLPKSFIIENLIKHLTTYKTLKKPPKIIKKLITNLLRTILK